jgi:hypothetical protein
MDGSSILALGAAALLFVLLLRWLEDRRRLSRAPRPEALVRVAVAENDLEAEIMRDRLRAAGIRAVVRSDDDLVAVRRVGVAAPFSRAILVLEYDADRAAALLKEHRTAHHPRRAPQRQKK